MQEPFPLVTIITPAYNRASFLDETIQSVLSQDYPNIEYIVLDDGSTDHTRQVLEKYSGRIIWESHPNMGETATVNKGFSMARGDIICVVNSDDPLLPGAVSEAVKLMQENPKVLAAYPDWDEIGPNSELIKKMQLPEYNILNMLTIFNVGMGPGTFFHRKVLDQVGMRDPNLKYTGDLDFWFRLALHGPLAHIPMALATHRTHQESASASGQGSRMAAEIVGLARKVYSHPDLPFEIKSIRAKVFCHAHDVAAKYCGSDHWAAFKHRLWAKLWSIWYDPWGYIKGVGYKVKSRSEEMREELESYKQEVEAYKQEVEAYKQEVESYKQDQELESYKQEVEAYKQEVEAYKQEMRTLSKELEVRNQEVRTLSQKLGVGTRR